MRLPEHARFKRRSPGPEYVAGLTVLGLRFAPLVVGVLLSVAIAAGYVRAAAPPLPASELMRTAYWQQGQQGPRQTLILHWDGAGWSVVPGITVHGNGYFNGVVALAPNDVWAVGTYHDGSFNRALVGRYNDPCGGLTPTTHAFYQYIETAYYQGIISGYSCGTGCLEYRPGNSVTRGQLCKIVVLARGWTLYAPPVPTFRDVPTTDPFYAHIETAYNRGIISGYSCGAGCLEFRPGNSATRGQICKIVYLAAGSPP
jgi:hypothetical protein